MGAPSFKSIIDALRNWGRRPDPDDPDRIAETARGGAQEISKLLPGDVMPREAILRKRAQMQALDEMLRNAGQ